MNKSALTLILALSLLLLASTARALDPLFGAPVNYEVGGWPESVFSADLDGDGDLDLAVPADIFPEGTKIAILINNGNASFQPPVTYDAPAPSSVFSADLDGDGDYDLAAAKCTTPSGGVSILLNNGDGTFAPRVNYGAGDSPRSVFSADFDGDSDKDLAVANANSDNVSILLNNGNGTFAPEGIYGTGDYPVSVFSADLDGDDDKDLAVANMYSENVSILLNQSGPYAVCGDCDGSGTVNILDVTRLINYLSVQRRPGAALPIRSCHSVNHGDGLKPIPFLLFGGLVCRRC